MRILVASIESEYRRYKALGEGAIGQLTDEQLCQVSHAGSNSVAALVWHIAGNFRSRFTDFLTSDGEKPWRDREAEFTRRKVDRAEVLKKWNEGWETLLGALALLDDGKLQDSVKIRGRALTVMEALLRSLAHASFHVGQILFWARDLKGANWQYLTIPPGQSESYNQNQFAEKGPGQS